MFSAYFSVKLYGNVTDLYAHAQTVDTRRSSPIFQAPGYEATYMLVLRYLSNFVSDS